MQNYFLNLLSTRSQTLYFVLTKYTIKLIKKNMQMSENDHSPLMISHNY